MDGQKRENRAKMTKVEGFIFSQRFILEAKFRHKKHSAQRALSEYVCNLRLEEQKVNGPIHGLMRPRPLQAATTGFDLA